MAKPTLFISDLHLHPSRPAISALFLRFLDETAHQAQALYILGDLFEYWLGDEAVGLEAWRPIIAALRRATATAGLEVYVMHGNRDFLLGEGFARATGCRLLAEPARIELYGEPTLLMHGDVLCTQDVEYQAFRAVVRDPAWQREFLARPLAEREALARRLRELSQQSTAQKKPEIMDVTPQAVEAVMRAHGVRRLIHGHTHRPGEHLFELDGEPARRMVLGDWYEQGSVLICTPAGWRLETLPLAASDEIRVARGEG
jgi:UDP-2,3-diacylglucosamine hydrolase